MRSSIASDIASIANSLWVVMNECDGHRFGQRDYDLTLDHIYDVVEEARAKALSLLATYEGAA